MATAGPGLGHHNDWYSTSQRRIVNGPQQGPGLGIYGDVYNPSTGRVQQVSSGGGGGGGGPTPSVPSVSEQEINSIYSPQMDYLNQVEAALRRDLPGTIAEAESAYKTNSGLLTNQKNRSMEGIDLQERQGTQKKDESIAQSRRILGEQRQAAQARFGGSSSAGEAANDLLGVEFLRQSGGINRDFNNFTQQIGFARKKVDDDFNQGMLQLEQQKQAAINQANRDFQNKLLEIANNRAQVESAKAQSRLSALMDLRNKVFAIQQQTSQFQNSLAQQRAADTAILDGYLNSSNQSLTGAQNSFSGFASNANATPQSLAMSGPGQTAVNPYVGSVRRREDENRFGFA